MITVCIPTVPQRKERLEICVDTLKKNTKEKYRLHVYENSDGGWVKACRNMLKSLHNDFVVILGDDSLPQPGWLKALYDSIDSTNIDSLFCVNDKAFKNLIAVFPAGPASYIRKYLYAGYVHYGADRELTDIAKAQGKFIWVPDSVILHDHFVYQSEGLKHAEMDSVYVECWNKNKKIDEALFEKRKKESHGFKNLGSIKLNES